jgi:hypothetical protein
MTRLSDEQRAAILADLRAGRPVRAIAADHGCNPSTVSRTAAAHGVACNVARTKKATAARKDWAQAARLELLNRLFAKADALLAGVDSPLHLQQLATATAVLIDKRRLEDGDATARTEVASPAADARERIAGRLDELAARRRTEGVA